MKSAFFSEDHEQFRAAVRDFIANEITPNIDEWEQNEDIPAEVWKKMGEADLLGINLPNSAGGSEADFFFSVVLLEELAQGASGGFGAALNVHQYMAMAYINKFGNKPLKDRYLIPGVKGKLLGALAVTEPNSGSDVAAIRTTARLDGEFYVINGSKTFVTNGVNADFVVTAVKTNANAGPGGISLIVIDRDAVGFSARKLDKIGWKCSDTGELFFDNVRVPANQLIGEENMGFYYIMEGFQLERLVTAVGAVSAAEQAISITSAYLNQREAFSRPLSKYQVIRHRLADCIAELEAARHLNYHACWLYDNQLPAIKESTMAKLISTELAKKVTDVCLQFHGGYGFMSEYPISRMYLDARAGTIVGGTSEIMREILSKLTFDSAVAPAAKVQTIKPAAPPQPLQPEPPAPPAAPGHSKTAATESSAPSQTNPSGNPPEQATKKAGTNQQATDNDQTILRDLPKPAAAAGDDDISAFQNEIERVITPSDKTGAVKKPAAAKNGSKPETKKANNSSGKGKADDSDSFSQEEIWEIQEELEKIISNADLPAAAGNRPATGEPGKDTDGESEDKTVMMTRPDIESKFPSDQEQSAKEKADPTVSEIFEGLKERFRSDKAEQYHGIFHYSITGEGGGNYTVMIDDGECKISDGLVGEPDCLIHTNASTFVDVELGRANQQVAFMMGKLKVSNVAQMMQFSTFFHKYGAEAEKS